MSVADALAADIHNGILASGDRLPTHRALAKQLGVTVKTVTKAYSELHRRGLTESVVGRGTFVRTTGDIDLVVTRNPSEIDLFSHMGVTAPLQDTFRRALYSLIKKENLDGLLAYQPAGGSTKHRAAGTEWASWRGLRTFPERTIVCSGTQHAVFTSLLALTKPGDLIATETLTYPGVKAAADQLGLRIEGLPIDEEGLIPEALDEFCKKRERPAVVVFVPTSHNPTLVTSGQVRREQLANVLARHALPFIEDDIFGHVVPDVPSPVATLLPESGLYICGTSKAMVPGLRTSFIIAPEKYAGALNAAVYGTMFAAPALPVEIATAGIVSGLAARMIAWHRRESASRIKLLQATLPRAAIRTAIGVYIAWMPQPAGLHYREMARSLKERGVIVGIADTFSVGTENHPPGIRISLAANASLKDLERGLSIIARFLRETIPL